MKALTVTIVALCFCGLLAASLALGEHYNTNPSPCQINARWDCGTVNHSHYAELEGVPVALIGILGYALLATLAGRFPTLTAVLAGLGLLFSLRLTLVEWKTLETWCLYCVSSQAVILGVFLVSLAAALRPRRRSGPKY